LDQTNYSFQAYAESFGDEKSAAGGPLAPLGKKRRT